MSRPPEARPRRSSEALRTSVILLDSAAIEVVADPGPPAADPEALDPSPSAQAADAAEPVLADLLLPPEERFELVSQLAEGGVGTIESTRDHALCRTIARKRIHEDALAQQALVRSFVREARITAALEHPGIVPVHDVSAGADGRVALSMKLVEGRSLEDILDDGPPADPAALVGLLEIVLRVCEALAFAHSRGVIHCDLKPGNILVGDYGQVYLTDWGFAVIRTRGVAELARIPPAPFDRGQAGQYAFGTPAYMPPEQAHGTLSAIGPRSDIFGVGAVLYHIVTGHPPFDADSGREAILRARRAYYPPLDAEIAAGRCPAALAKIIYRAMSRRPEDRYRHMDELLRELRALIRGGETLTRDVRAGEIVLREGDASDGAYAIVTGELEAFRGEGEARVSLARMGPGDVFGELGLLSGDRRLASVVALTDAHLIIVTPDQFDRELSSTRPWLALLFRSLATRFVGLTRPSAKAD